MVAIAPIPFKCSSPPPSLKTFPAVYHGKTKNASKKIKVLIKDKLERKQTKKPE